MIEPGHILGRHNALIQLGGGVTAISGSIGGTTFARSQAGAYARQKTKPINPKSSTQMARRANVAWLSTYWSKTLTEQQRTDWRAYATGTTWTNKLGNTININGLAAFLRLNVLQRLIPSEIIAAAPLAMGHGGGIDFTFSAESDTSKIQINEPDIAFDKDVDIQNIWFFQGLPCEAGRLATPKGFKYIGRVWGSSGAPLTFPYELDSAYTMQAGQLVTVRAMWHDENYRVAGPFWAKATAAPA